MEIVDKSGECFDLTADVVLEITRSNPFFNEYGEQSLPVVLPATDKNKRLLGYPERLDIVSKVDQRSDVIVRAGVYIMKGRMVVLSANNKTGIEVCVYLNEGAFYEKFNDLQLSEVFKDDVVKFGNVDAAVSFVQNLMCVRDERFACFQVSKLNKVNPTVNANGYYNLFNAVQQVEVVDEKTITLAAGFYITPFVRANYVLKCVFEHLGYQLNDNFFTRTAPFSDMVFLNNNADSIMNAEIRVEQLVPDCMASTILEIFRNRFCCEFIPNEVDKTIDIVLFKELLHNTKTTDLTNCIVGTHTISYPGQYKCVKLSSEAYYDAVNSTDGTRVRGPKVSNIQEIDNLRELLNKYPDAMIDYVTGEVYRVGFRAERKHIEVIGYLQSGYYAGGSLDTHDVQCSDVTLRMSQTKRLGGARPDSYSLSPNIKDTRFLNSKLVFDDEEENTSSSDTSEDDTSLKPMLCFVIHNPSRKRDFGTVLNYDEKGVQVWDYTLAFNGGYGLFERFWRDYDNCLRNSFCTVECELLLSEVDKMQLSSSSKISINGNIFLPNELTYFPSEKQLSVGSFLTTKLYEPVSVAENEGENIELYYWISDFTRSNTDTQSYPKWSVTDSISVIFHKQPTEVEFNKGGRFFQKTYNAVFYKRSSTDGPVDPVSGTVTIWLTPIKA